MSSGGTFEFYNDVYAFNTILRHFVPISAAGTPPIRGWSAAAVLKGNDFWVFGGCTSSTENPSSKLRRLRLYFAASADACEVSGDIYKATAGQPSNIHIQFRDVQYSSSQYSSSELAWSRSHTGS